MPISTSLTYPTTLPVEAFRCQQDITTSEALVLTEYGY